MYISGMFTLNGSTSRKPAVQNCVGQAGRVIAAEGMPMQIQFCNGDVLTSNLICSVKSYALGRALKIVTMSGTVYQMAATCC